MIYCVLCDWQYSWTDPAPLAGVYRMGKISPLQWTTRGILQQPMSGDPDAVESAMVAAHWAREHPEQFRRALEVDQGVTEWFWSPAF